MKGVLGKKLNDIPPPPFSTFLPLFLPPFILFYQSYGVTGHGTDLDGDVSLFLVLRVLPYSLPTGKLYVTGTGDH